jgi:hypothetical protein
MTTKHTPGPWYSGIDDWCVYAGTRNAPNQPYVVREMAAQNREANARLIAAAPDMLEALKAANLELRSALGGPLSIDREENRTPARLAQRDSIWTAIQTNEAAIAKAEGRA